MRAYMTSLRLSTGISSYAWKKKVLVPSTTPGRPCANRPISFAFALLHTSQYSGLAIKCQYSISSPVLGSKTAPASSHIICNGYRLHARFFAFSGTLVISIADSIASVVMDLSSLRRKLYHG
jgi:hypothetical protein